MPVSTPLGKRLLLAFIGGRKTARTYRQPLSYVRDGNTLLTPGAGKWTRNLMGDPMVRLRIRGRDVTARAELVNNLEEVTRLFTFILALNPSSDAFLHTKRNLDGSLSTEHLRCAINAGFRIVRWHLNELPPRAFSNE
jgi:hypothetical protein